MYLCLCSILATVSRVKFSGKLKIVADISYSACHLLCAVFFLLSRDQGDSIMNSLSLWPLSAIIDACVLSLLSFFLLFILFLFSSLCCHFSILFFFSLNVSLHLASFPTVLPSAFYTLIQSAVVVVGRSKFSGWLSRFLMLLHRMPSQAAYVLYFIQHFCVCLWQWWWDWNTKVVALATACSRQSFLCRRWNGHVPDVGWQAGGRPAASERPSSEYAAWIQRGQVPAPARSQSDDITGANWTTGSRGAAPAQRTCWKDYRGAETAARTSGSSADNRRTPVIAAAAAELGGRHTGQWGRDDNRRELSRLMNTCLYWRNETSAHYHLLLEWLVAGELWNLLSRATRMFQLYDGYCQQMTVTLLTPQRCVTISMFILCKTVTIPTVVWGDSFSSVSAV